MSHEAVEARLVSLFKYQTRLNHGDLEVSQDSSAGICQ